MSTYSLSWGNSAAFSSLLNSGRYLLSPEQRAKQIIKVTREADIEFCRGFWNLSELPPPRLFCPSMEVYQINTIPMCGPLTLESKTPGQLISVPEPSSHGPPKAIPITILSSKHREGLVNLKNVSVINLKMFSRLEAPVSLCHQIWSFIVTEEVMLQRLANHTRLICESGPSILIALLCRLTIHCRLSFHTQDQLRKFCMHTHGS